MGDDVDLPLTADLSAQSQYMNILIANLCCFDQFSDSPNHSVQFMNCGSCCQLSSIGDKDIRNLSCTSHTSNIVVFGSGCCRYELDIVALVSVLTSEYYVKRVNRWINRIND